MDAIQNTSNCIAYIDLFKGIAIIGVVWVHSHIPPSWLTPFLVNSIFFFISGCFFNRRQDSFYNLIIKNTKRILIPFLFFYVLSYPFRIIVHFWDYRTLSNFDWLCVFDVFHFNAKPDYLFVNVPLWFLLSLFFINIFYFAIRKFPDIIIVLIAAACLFLKSFFYSIPSFFTINVSLYWLGMFALGNILGQRFIKLLSKKSFNKYIFILISSLIYIILSSTKLIYTEVILADIFIHLNMLLLILILFSISSLLVQYRQGGGSCIFNILNLYGINSLIILGFHVWVLIPIGRILYKIFGQANIATGITATFFTMIAAIVFIKFCNSTIPRLVGKKSISS